MLASGKIARHHAVRDLLAKHLNKVGTTAIEQPVPGAPELRGDILFYAHGKRVTIDVTLTAQCAPTLAAKGAWKQAGYAADAAWKRKHQTYWRAAEPNAGPGGQCRDVVPFVLEISGRLFSKSRAWLARAFGGAQPAPKRPPAAQPAPEAQICLTSARAGKAVPADG